MTVTRVGDVGADDECACRGWLSRLVELSGDWDVQADAPESVLSAAGLVVS